MASTPAKQPDPQEVVLFDRSSMSFPPIGQSRHPSESALASAPFWTSTDGARPSLEPPGSGPGSRDSRSSSMPFDPLLITDRETRLNNVRRLSSQIQKLLQETQGELSKEAYNDLYQSAVSLLKAVDLLDPQQSSGRISDVFQMGSFSQSGAQQPPTQATMLTAVPNDLDWLSRRSMELFPRASFSAFPESPLVHQLAPPGPSSVHANGSTMLVSSSSSSTSSSDAPLPVGTMQLGQIKAVQQQQQQQMQQQMQQQQQQQQMQQQQQQHQQQHQQQQIQQQLQQPVPPPRAVLQSPAPYFTNNSQMVVGPGQFAMQQYVRQQQLPSSVQQQPPPSAYYPRPFVTHQQPLTSSASFSPSTPSFQYTPTSPLRMSHSSRAPTEIVFTSNEQKPKKRLPANAKKNLKCMMCHVTETPEWRRGPNGDHTLCNACGLHYAKQLRKEKHASKKKRKTSIESILNKDKQTVTVTATPSAAAAAIAHQSEKKSPVSGDDLGDSTT